STLLIFGGVYLLVMVIRSVVRMALCPHERWTGGSIPIFFHWVLAMYVLVLGIHHWRHDRSWQEAQTPGAFRRWFLRLAWLLGGSVITAGLALWIIYL